MGLTRSQCKRLVVSKHQVGCLNIQALYLDRVSTHPPATAGGTDPVQVRGKAAEFQVLGYYAVKTAAIDFKENTNA